MYSIQHSYDLVTAVYFVYIMPPVSRISCVWANCAGGPSSDIDYLHEPVDGEWRPLRSHPLRAPKSRQYTL